MEKAAPLSAGCVGPWQTHGNCDRVAKSHSDDMLPARRASRMSPSNGTRATPGRCGPGQQRTHAQTADG